MKRAETGHSYAVLVILLLSQAFCVKDKPPTPETVTTPASTQILGDTLPPLTAQRPSAEGGVVTVAIDAEPPSLNYQLDPPDATAKMIHELIYDSLARPRADNFEPEGRLAQSWESSPDHMRFTFKLREDVRWHDGTPFTADDVIFTFKALLNKKHNTNVIRSFLEPLKSVQKLSTFVVRFELKRPYWYAFDAVSGIYIYPKHLMDGGDFNHHILNRAPVGTGPYVFTRWVSGDYIELRRNADYFAGASKPERMVFLYVPDATARIQLVRRAQVDVVLRVPPQSWRSLLNDTVVGAGFWRLRHIPNGMQWIGWNNRRSPFDDKRVRQAMTMLIDRDDIIANLRLGIDAKTASWFYPGSKEHHQSLKPLPYDPKAAVQLLNAAGWKDSDHDGFLDAQGKRFEFDFIYPAGPPFYEQLAGLMREELKAVGIVVHSKKVEWSVYLQRLSRGNFGACSLLWQLYPRGDPYQIWHSAEAQKGSNYVAFKNAEADDILERARGVFDENKRLSLYRRFSEILQEQQPYTMLFSRYNLSLVSKRLGGIVSSPYGIIRLESLYVAQEANVSRVH